MMKLSLSEIENWQDFESLIADYFSGLGQLETNNISNVEVQQGGDGGDGGMDMLVTFQFFDVIDNHQKKWVVQCKFLERSVSKADLATVNIPSLIHEYGADGYILICKNRVTKILAIMFENLQRNCKFGYSYKIWRGNDFIQQLKGRRDLTLQYFPKFHNFMK